MSLSTFGIREVGHTTNEVERAVEEIRIAGFTLIDAAIELAELPALRESLEAIYRHQVEDIGGAERLGQINDTWNARALLAYDERFLRVATSPKVLPIVTALLGEYFILMLQNGVLNPPVTGQQQNAGSWHRDLNYQHYVSSRPLSVSALFCLDEFSETTGGTAVLPGSHKVEAFPSEAYVLTHQKTIEAPAGAVVVFDSMLFHRGGLNRSGAPRRALNHMYTMPLLKQQISFPRLLQGKYADDPFLNRFLGYDCEPPDDVRQFRELRLARVHA